jgi:voltage-gated potassium channel Kch
MARAPTIDSIRASRDTALSALGVAFDAVGQEIARTTQTGAFLDRLTDRHDALRDERAAVRDAAVEAVLALPEVVTAANTLAGLSDKMQAVAAVLPTATDILNKTATVLSLAQQFVDLVATAQQG